MLTPLLSQIPKVSDEECMARIREHKRRLGRGLYMPVHNYQRNELVQLADDVGDSLELARKAYENKEASHIIFCGVHFMAQTARVVAEDYQRVFLPNFRAGCPMADMADVNDVEAGWQELRQVIPIGVTPACYVNSTADIKAFCGRYGGATCTSSNALKVFDALLRGGNRIFFMPDEHLGRNMANALGIPRTQIVEWDPKEELGGLDPETLRQARVILWKGYCHVHTHFTVEMVEKVRKEHPGCVVIAHPECTEDLVAAADHSGSTKFMADFVEAASSGSVTVLATEVNHPNNLNIKYPNKTVLDLSRSLCPNMYKINLRNVLFTLENLGEMDEIVLTPDVISDAKLAVEKMFQLS
jgi:quinolinate synthase